MKNFKCKNCGHEISIKALFCPSCGHPNQQNCCFSVTHIIVILIITIALTVALVIGLDINFNNKRHDNYNQLALDAVEQYNVIKKTGEHAKICVHARIVAASYLKANDQAKYHKWKEIGDIECSR